MTEPVSHPKPGTATAPTPWRVLPQRPGKDFLEISDDDGLIQIAEVAGTRRLPTAELIVSAVNSLASLKARNEELTKALEFYARGGDVAKAQDIASGDVDLARVSEALTEDCGDVARAVLLQSKGGK